MVFTLLSGSVLSLRGFFVKAADADVIRNDETGIPDPVLYQMVLKELGKTPDSVFTEAEAQTVLRLEQEFLYVDDSGRKEDQVVSLQGMEKLANLLSFKLATNKITDLKPLQNLTKLRTLDLSCSNCIKSIEEIRCLTQLEYLRLPPAVTDLSPVGGMTKLLGLGAANAGISKLPDLTGHTKLVSHYVFLDGNNLTKKELTTKLPKQLVNDKSWLKHMADLQQYNVKKMKKILKVTSPKKVAKITGRTKTIIGKAAKNVTVDLYYRSGNPGTGELIKTAKVDKKGVFKMKNLKLKKYKKKKLYLVSSYYSPFFSDEPYVMKTIAFRMKK